MFQCQKLMVSTYQPFAYVSSDGDYHDANHTQQLLTFADDFQNAFMRRSMPSMKSCLQTAGDALDSFHLFTGVMETIQISSPINFVNVTLQIRVPQSLALLSSAVAKCESAEKEVSHLLTKAWEVLKNPIMYVVDVKDGLVHNVFVNRREIWADVLRIAEATRAGNFSQTGADFGNMLGDILMPSVTAY